MNIEEAIERMRAQVEESQAYAHYVSYYGLQFDANHQMQYITSNDEQLFVHQFTPKEIKRTVLLVHGYLDHSGTLRKLISFLLERSCEVYTFDLVGHGLSTGEPAHIQSFSDYSEHLVNVLRFINKPIDVIAHSTGAASVINLLLTVQCDMIKRVVLVAPLVRSSQWYVSIVGKRILQGVQKQVKRKFKQNSYDLDYLAFVKQDPLQARYIPFTWVNAMEVWVKEFAEFEPSEKQVVILQGTHDQTVDWKFNLKMLKTKFPRSKRVIIDRGQHQLWNEAVPIREQVFSLIAKSLYI